VPEGLTVMQAKAKRFIAEYTRQHERSPSFPEIGRAIGVTSKSSVHRIVAGLEERGHLTFVPRSARSIRIVQHLCPHCGGNLLAAPVHPEKFHGGDA
jgi:repressor LexA